MDSRRREGKLGNGTAAARAVIGEPCFWRGEGRGGQPNDLLICSSFARHRSISACTLLGGGWVVRASVACAKKPAPGKLGAAAWWAAQAKLGINHRVGQPERAASFCYAPLSPTFRMAPEPPLLCCKGTQRLAHGKLLGSININSWST